MRIQLSYPISISLIAILTWDGMCSYKFVILNQQRESGYNNVISDFFYYVHCSFTHAGKSLNLQRRVFSLHLQA